MKEKISIIIPAYNAEKTIRNCIMSFINQKGGGELFDYELIVVNDGSSDKTSEIVSNIISNSEKLKIKLINIKNQGPAFARKTGIENSESDLLGFCDSDDYVDPDFLFTQYTLLKKHNADFVKISAYLNEKVPLSMTQPPYDTYIFNRTEAIEKFLEHDLLNGSLVTNLFKRELFNDLDWNFQMRLYEDDLLIWQIVQRSKIVVRVKIPRYHYMFQNGSLTNRDFSIGNFHSTKILTERIVNECAKKKDLNRFHELALEMQYKWIVGCYFSLLKSKIKDQEAENYMRNIIKRNFKRVINLPSHKEKIKAISLVISPQLVRRVSKYL